MPHDLYGTYYPTEREALAAEMSQCAAIDASIAARDVRLLQEHAQYEAEMTEQWKLHIEERLSRLEKLLAALAGKEQDE